MLQAVGTGRDKSVCIELTAELYGQLEAIAEKQGSKLEDEVEQPSERTLSGCVHIEMIPSSPWVRRENPA